MISTMDNALADAENGVSDEKIKEKYEPKIKSIAERMKKLKEPTKEEAERMVEAMKTGMKKLEPRMKKVAEKTGKRMPSMPTMPGSPFGGF